MANFRVSCTVTYRRTWDHIEADSAEEAQKYVFDDAGDADSEELVDGPGGWDDMKVEEEV